jgi:CRISPR-associated protein Cas8c/Csd1 subtype I-C
MRDVHFVIEIGRNGKFLGIAPLGDVEGKKRSAKKMPTPNRDRGGSSPPPLLFVDKSNYALAIADPKDKVKALSPQQAHQNFVQLIRDLLNYCPSQSSQEAQLIQVALQFLESEERHKATELLQQRFEDRDSDQKNKVFDKNLHPKSSDFFALRVDGHWLHDLQSARSFWAKHCRQLSSAQIDATTTTENKNHAEHESTDNSDQLPLIDDGSQDAPLRCLITNEAGNIARLHDDVKLGSQNCQIVSANRPAFLSYGLEQSQIAPISIDAMKSYTQSLQHLLLKDEHHAHLGGTSYIFWTNELQQGLPIDIFDDVQPEHLSVLFRSVYSGKKDDLDLVEQSAFYAAALRSNQKRLIVCSYLESTVGQVKQNLAHWFDAHAIHYADMNEKTNENRYFGLRKLASAFQRRLGSKFESIDELPPMIFRSLFEAALNGRPLPLGMLAQLILRLRCDGLLIDRPQRAALMRLILNLHQTSEKNYMTPALDPKQSNPAYVCGRLFAVLENLQYAALGKTNATIADRFMGTASAAPASVFGRLMRGSQPHLQKLRKDNETAYHAIQNRIAEILNLISEFPATLDLKAQATFALGYYHQRHSERAAMLLRKQEGLAELLGETSESPKEPTPQQATLPLG